MIVDITNELYSILKTALTGITTLTDYPSTVPNFPTVVFTEMFNNSNPSTIDSGGENHSLVAYEVNIFSNKQNKRTEVKIIRNQVDAILSDIYGLERTLSEPTPNFADDSVYKYTLRYNGVIDKNKKIYRR